MSNGFSKGEKVEVMINGKWISAYVTGVWQMGGSRGYSVEINYVEEEDIRKYDDSGYKRVGAQDGNKRIPKR